MDHSRRADTRADSAMPQAIPFRFVVWDRLVLLLGNLLLALLWPAFNGDYTIRASLWGFALGVLILTAYHRPYLLWLLRLALFVLYLLWSIAASSVRVAIQILLRRTRAQAIVAYELEADSDLETLMMASAVTLTPGTIAVDAQYDGEGQRILFVHLLDGRDPDRFRADLKYGFERRILQLVRE